MRYRHRDTDVVVAVRDDKHMGREWAPLDSAGGSYDDRTVAELRDEIDRRNEGRESDEQLSPSGRKAELIAALEADDGR